MLNPMDIIHEQVADPALLIRRQNATAGYFGANFPWEILLAAGFAPVRLCGFPGETSTDEGLSSQTASLLAAHRREALGLDLLCLPESHPDFDALNAEKGLAERVLVLPDFDSMPEETLQVFTQLLEKLNEIGSSCTDEALTAALVRSNLARYRFGELEEKIFSAKSFLQYSDLLAMSLLGQWTDRESWTDLVNDLVANPLENVLLGLPVRVFLGGGDIVSPIIAHTLERLDLHVCADRHGATGGHWSGGIEPDGDPLKNLADFYARKTTVLSENDVQAEALLQSIEKSRADGVLWIADPDDAQEVRNAEILQAALEKREIPVCVLKHRPWSDLEEIQFERLEAFAETL